MGYTGTLNLRNPTHQKFIVKTLSTKGLTGMELFEQMATLIQCDVLWDHKNKTHAARLIMWIAWNDKMKFQDMHWFKPCLKLVKVNTWTTQMCYGEAAAYGRCLSVELNPVSRRPTILWMHEAPIVQEHLLGYVPDWARALQMNGL